LFIPTGGFGHFITPLSMYILYLIYIISPLS
jgi:hypothetical protein